MIREDKVIDTHEDFSSIFVPNRHFFVIFAQLKEQAKELDDHSRKQYEALVEFSIELE